MSRLATVLLRWDSVLYGILDFRVEIDIYVGGCVCWVGGEEGERGGRGGGGERMGSCEGDDVGWCV